MKYCEDQANLRANFDIRNSLSIIWKRSPVIVFLWKISWNVFSRQAQHMFWLISAALPCFSAQTPHSRLLAPPINWMDIGVRFVRPENPPKNVSVFFSSRILLLSKVLGFFWDFRILFRLKIFGRCLVNPGRAIYLEYASTAAWMPNATDGRRRWEFPQFHAVLSTHKRSVPK